MYFEFKVVETNPVTQVKAIGFLLAPASAGALIISYIMEIAIKVLQTEISDRQGMIYKENLMLKDKRKAMELLKEISKIKQALKLLKDHHQRRVFNGFE